MEKRGGGRKKAYGENTAEKIIEYAEENRNATARGIARNNEINKNGLSHLTIGRILSDERWCPIFPKNFYQVIYNLVKIFF